MLILILETTVDFTRVPETEVNGALLQEVATDASRLGVAPLSRRRRARARSPNGPAIGEYSGSARG